MTSHSQKRARPASHPRTPLRRPRVARNVMSPLRRSSHRRRLSPLVRPGRPRLNRSRLGHLLRPRRPFRRAPDQRRMPRCPPQQPLDPRQKPSRPRRARPMFRHRAPCRLICHRRGVSLLRAARSLRARCCHRRGGRPHEPTNRQHHRGQLPTMRLAQRCRRRPACRCRRSRPMASRSRRRRCRHVPDPASRSRRRQALPAHLTAAAPPIAPVRLVGSAVPRAAVIARTAARLVAGALMPELRRLQADAQAVLPAARVRAGRAVHHEAVREVARADAVAASARNCSPSSSPHTRRWMHPFPTARSSSSEARRLKRSPPG